MARAATAAVRLLTGEREPVRLATTAALTTSVVDGVEKIFGLQTVDGVVPSVGDRVLVKDQGTASINGIYDASTGEWRRSADARTSRTLQKGTTVHVQNGATNSSKVFSFQTDRPNLGTDPIVVAFYISDDVLGDIDGAIAAGEALLQAVLDQVNTQVADAAASADSAEDDADATAADRVQTGLDRVATAADRVQTGIDKAAAAASAATATAKELLTDADAIATAADRVQTGLDRAATAVDKAAVAADKATVAADKVIVAADKATVAADKATVSSDKALVAGYRDEVEADRLDVQADKVLAAGFASDAATSAGEAAAVRDEILAYGDWNNRYIGEHATDPVNWNETDPLDPGTDPLIPGLVYFNTVSNGYLTYSGSEWASGSGDTSDFARKSLNGSDYAASTFRTNLDLYSTAQVNALPGSVAAKTTPVDADSWQIWDSVASAWKRVTGTNVKVYLKAYFDTLYQPVLVTLTSWGGITRASGFDTFAATPSWTNFLALVTGEPTFYTSGGTDVAITDGGTGASTASAAFTNLKQAATETATGVVELATTAEATTASDTTRAVTPAGIGAERAATATLSGKTLVDPAITGSIVEDVYTISDGAGFAINPRNGSLQEITLGANRTPVASSFNSGDSVTLRIADGSAFAITWTTVGVVWKGGTAPTLATSGWTVVELWKEGSTIRGAVVGDFAS